MLDAPSLLLFAAATVGLTNIIVDPAAIAKPFRDLVDRNFHPWLSKLFSCYQCTGTWAGFLCGYILITKEPWLVFLCGMAGSYLATMSATYMNYLEAKSILAVEDDA